jgi:hypothetical protein
MPTATAAKWTKGTVTVNWRDDATWTRSIREIPGLILGNIGIIVNQELTGWCGPKTYRITHIPSGLGFCSPFRRLRDAKATVEAILEIEGAAEMTDACGRGENYDTDLGNKVANLVRRMYAELNP